EEAAAVRPELLDRDLRGRWADGDDLLGQRRLLRLRLALLVHDRPAVLVGHRLVVLGRLPHRDLGVRGERLTHALGDERERGNEKERQEKMERGTREINPEVADRLGGAAGESPD